MDLSIPLIRLAFLALPGLLASKFYRKLRGRTVKKNWEDFLEILLFSLLSYLVLALISKKPPETLTVFDTISDGNKETIPINYSEIAWASFIGLVLAIVASYIHTYKLITRMCRRIRATHRIADEDIWSLFHESEKNIDWLFIRDHKLNLIYYGCITYYSDSGSERELIIEDVTVFNVNGDRLYETPSIYIARDKYDFTLELIGEDAKINTENATHSENGSLDRENMVKDCFNEPKSEQTDK